MSALRGRGRPPPPRTPDLAPEIEVELSGCAAVLDGPICEVPEDGVLRAWVHAAPDAVSFSTESAKVAATTLRELEGGGVHRVVVPAGARELRVGAKAALAGRALGSRTFRLAAPSAPAWLAEAKAARRRGDAAAATALVAARQTSSDHAERAFALGMRARLELSAGHPDAAFPLFRQSATLHRKAGRLSNAADDSFALAFALNQRSYRYTAARAVLDDVRAWGMPYADGRARESYYRATLSMETGDPRAALRLLREARRRAARLGLTVLERNAINAYALGLEHVGRVPEALELLRGLARDADAAGAAPCEKVEIAINLGFGALLANERAPTGTERADPMPVLEHALEQKCDDKYLTTAALGNLALAALQRGEPLVARARLARAREDIGEARAVEVLFWSDLDGRIALAEGNARRALAAFDEELRLARGALSFESEWRAAVGRGEALERLGRNDAALESYRTAEQRLTAVSFLVPLGEGRGTFVGDRAKSAKLAIDLLVRLGRTGEALAVARASRSRVLSGLARNARVEGFGDAERTRWEKALAAYRAARARLDAEAKDDWRLPRTEAAEARLARTRRESELRSLLDDALAVFAEAKTSRAAVEQLEPLPTDAVTLAFHPVRRGWLGFVAEGTQISSFAIARPPGNDDAARAELLTPLHGHLEGVRRVRVLPYGELRGLDFHALPFDGAPLLATIAVEYPLDLPRQSGATSPTGDAHAALVVTDPTLDLKGAETESDHVVRALRDREGWEVTVLEGSHATSAAVLPALARSRHLHYAGHGVFAGREGWQSALPLAGGGHLTIGDLLAASAVPSRVVLSGCETALSDHDAPSESLGLAQSFVIAGADFVIAPVRPVDDAIAARLSVLLYGKLASKGEVDAAAILRDAQLELRKEDHATDWSAFRVVRR